MSLEKYCTDVATTYLQRFVSYVEEKIVYLTQLECKIRLLTCATIYIINNNKKQKTSFTYQNPNINDDIIINIHNLYTSTKNISCLL